jgi:hypothetical protein
LVSSAVTVIDCYTTMGAMRSLARLEPGVGRHEAFGLVGCDVGTILPVWG